MHACCVSHRCEFSSWFLHQQFRNPFANCFVRIERWKQFSHFHSQHLPKKTNLLIVHMDKLCFYFRDTAAAGIPPRELQMQRKIGLRPTALTPQSPDLRSHNISVREGFHNVLRKIPQQHSPPALVLAQLKRAAWLWAVCEDWRLNRSKSIRQADRSERDVVLAMTTGAARPFMKNGRL